MNWEAIAQLAYEKYRYHAKLSGHLDFMPAWERLSMPKRMAWQAAVREACDVFAAAVTA